MPFKQIPTKEAFQKIKYYCSYQERSHTEVKEKLYGFGLRKSQVEAYLSQLIEEGYLNEERFAKSFAGGKFRIKKWGRIKIKYELKQKQVSEFNIKNALREIDEKDYLIMLQKLTDEKWMNLKKEPDISRQSKTFNHLLQKGYEAPLIQLAIKTEREKDS